MNIHTQHSQFDGDGDFASWVIQGQSVVSCVWPLDLAQSQCGHVVYGLTLYSLLLWQWFIVIGPGCFRLWITLEWNLKGCGLASLKNHLLFELFVQK